MKVSNKDVVTLKVVFDGMRPGRDKELVRRAVESGLLSWDNPYDDVTYQILRSVMKGADRRKKAEERTGERVEGQGRGAGEKICTGPLNLESDEGIDIDELRDQGKTVDEPANEKRGWVCSICGHVYDSYDSAIRCQDSHRALMAEERYQPKPQKGGRTYRPEPPPKKMGVLEKVVIGIGFFFLIVIVLAALASIAPVDRPASFKVENVYVEPAEVPVGHEARVTVTVLNRGDLTGTTAIDVRAACEGTDVETVGQEAVTLDGGQSKTLAFTFKPSKVGVWKITVEGTTVSLVLQVRMLVSAEELAEEYEINEVAADLKYENKIFYVYGVIDDIGKSLWDNPTVSLEVSGFFNDVQCTFKKSEAEKIAALREGDQILVRGKGEGSALGLWIYMEDCELVS